MLPGSPVTGQMYVEYFIPKTLSHPYPDVILTDYQMPGTMGNDLADQMRAICGPSTQLLAMSGSDSPDARSELFDAFLPELPLMGLRRAVELWQLETRKQGELG